MLKALLRTLLNLTSKKGSDGSFRTMMRSCMAQDPLLILPTLLLAMVIS